MTKPTPLLPLRRPSVSTAGLRVAIGKTPLDRMKQVTELGRRGRLMERLANRARANDPNRAR